MGPTKQSINEQKCPKMEKIAKQPSFVMEMGQIDKD